MTQSLQTCRLVLLLVAVYISFTVHSFVLAPIIPKQSSGSGMSLRPADVPPASTCTTRIQALASPPAEDEKEKKKRNDNTHSKHKKDDWTPSQGGFLPNLGKTRQTTPIIQQVLTIEDYKRVVVDEEDTMVVVRFYTPWCRACKAVQPLYEKLAREYSPSIKFVEVPLTRHNAFLHEGLGVDSFPFAHIYDPTVGLVEEMSMNKRTFHHFRHVLETYIDGSCDLPQEDL